ncbi:RNA methyltransferase [Spongiimicrobium salis]|uniref:RNA methyltransferase n=1 Tax=Spongiimicrobium salis TaxID=1667022 RepID=UPI00374CDC6C
MFVVEGIKMVQELLDSDFVAHKVYSTQVELLRTQAEIIEQVSEAELKKMSGLQHPNTALGVFFIPEHKSISTEGWSVALDDVRDPGNLGTIIRLCDWYGIEHLICSRNTVDCYNPKVLQATMGSITRVQLHYVDLEKQLQEDPRKVYGAFMDGDDMRQQNFPSEGILLMGNEANGISKDMQALVNVKTAIPQFGEKTAESLNVATATAILLSELHRT